MKLAATIEPGGDVGAPVIWRDQLWMLTGLHLVSIDKKTNRVVERAALQGPGGAAVADGTLWVTNRSNLLSSAWPDKQIGTHLRASHGGVLSLQPAGSSLGRSAPAVSQLARNAEGSKVPRYRLLILILLEGAGGNGRLCGIWRRFRRPRGAGRSPSCCAPTLAEDGAAAPKITRSAAAVASQARLGRTPGRRTARRPGEMG
jgi:hypothetical protein